MELSVTGLNPDVNDRLALKEARCPLPMLIDTHAHLDYPDFERDFADVLRRADEAGVTRIITIGTSIKSSRRAIALAEKYANIFAAVGFHPSSVDDAPEDVATPLRELARHPRVVAIGETGLDYHHLPSESQLGVVLDPNTSALTGGAAGAVQHALDAGYKAAQATLFQQQLDLAVEFGLNAVIHQRDAWEDTLDILRPYAGKVRGVFHCFGGTLEQAQEILALGHIVSFTGIVTFKNARTVQDCAARLSPEAFMLETDCPYLAPVPFRGKRCEPAHTRVTAEAVANLRGETFDALAVQTTRNADKFFRFERG
jgi:TatD DNase family protein